MNNPNERERGEDEAEAPLSPEALVVIGKAHRSFAISMGILIVGFMAIGLAIVYRVLRNAPPPQLAAELSLPDGAEVVAALLADGAINVTYRVGATTTLALFDPETGALERSVVVVP